MGNNEYIAMTGIFATEPRRAGYALCGNRQVPRPRARYLVCRPTPMRPGCRGAARRRLVRIVRAHARSCRWGNCAERSHHTSSLGLSVGRGIGVLAFTCALMGIMHLASPGMPTARHLLAQCQAVNVYGDCQSESGASEGTDPCVLINAVGACENRYQVEHPAHTMVK